MPRKKAASFKCSQCGKEFAMAMHLGRHKTTIHGQASKAAKRKKAARVSVRTGRPAGRPPAIVGGMDLHDLTLDRLADVITGAREEVARRIAQIQELLLPVVTRRPGRPLSQPVVAAAAPKAPAPKTPAKQKRRKPGKFKLTGSESILAFLKDKGAKGATGAEIVKHWESQGRGSTAYVNIGELVKAKKLKKEPLKGQKGSRYTAA